VERTKKHFRDLQGGWLMNGANGNGNGKEGRRFVRLLR
jgi:predicted DNA-binding ArsR family transcriptional regulator